MRAHKPSFMSVAVPILFVTLCALSSRSAVAQATYAITDLGSLAGQVEATGINNLGQVVGDFQDQAPTGGGNTYPWAFLWDPTAGMQSLPAFNCVPMGISDSGRVFGRTTPGWFVYDTSTHGPLVLEGADVPFLPRAIDPTGLLAGAWTSPIDGHTYAATFDLQTVTPLPATSGFAYSQAEGINNGRVVGWWLDTSGPATFHAFLSQGATVTPIGTFGGLNSSANAVNASGQVVGSADTTVLDPSGYPHPFLYTGGQLIDLGLVVGNTTGVASRINASGQVIGACGFPGAFGGTPFVWTPTSPNATTGSIARLIDVIPPDSGWDLNFATGISDAGQIVGYGFHNGGLRGFLLTPIQSVKISHAKLSLPIYTTDSGGKYLFTVHVKGSGQGSMHGHWLLDSVPVQSETSFDLNLSSGTWVAGPTIALSANELNGHTLRFQVDEAGSVSTSGMSAVITSFNAQLNGWHFSNNFAAKFGPLDGYCMGMSRIAMEDYNFGFSLPNGGQFSKNVVYTYIWPAHVQGALWLRTVDVTRLSLYATDQDSLRSETDRVRERLTSGRARVVGLLPSRKWSDFTTAHAVVATSCFYDDDVYEVDAPDTNYSVRHFFVYDPNFVGQFRDLDVYEAGGVVWLKCPPYDYSFIADFTGRVLPPY